MSRAPAGMRAASGGTVVGHGVGRTNDYFVELDPAPVRRQGPHAMAWTRMTFTVPQQAKGNTAAKFQSELQLHAIDCASSTATVVGIVLYTGALGQGEIIERSTRARAEWRLQQTPLGSLAEVTVRLACAELTHRGSQ